MSRRFQFSLGALLGVTAIVAICVWELQTDAEFGRMPDRPHQAVRALVRLAAMICAAAIVVRAIWRGK